MPSSPPSCAADQYRGFIWPPNVGDIRVRRKVYDEGPKTCQHHRRTAKNAIADNTVAFERFWDLVPMRSGWRRLMTMMMDRGIQMAQLSLNAIPASLNEERVICLSKIRHLGCEM